jgi:hypothetical protein
MISIDSPSDPSPRKLRWYQFSLRSIFVVMTLFALGLGLYIKYVKQDEERRARCKYFVETVLDFGKFVQWVEKPALSHRFSGDSSCIGAGSSPQGKACYKYSIQYSRGNEPAECVAALAQYFSEKNIFHNLQSVEILEDKITLKSDEGWLKLETKWLPDKPSEIDNLKRMQIKNMQLEVEFEFQPLHSTSETDKTP